MILAKCRFRYGSTLDSKEWLPAADIVDGSPKVLGKSCQQWVILSKDPLIQAPDCVFSRNSVCTVYNKRSSFGLYFHCGKTCPRGGAQRIHPCAGQP